MFPKAIMNFDDNETGANNNTESGAYDSVVVPANAADNPDPGSQAECYGC